MKRALARLKWGLPVMWDAGDELPAQLTATAEVVPQVTVNHYHLHIEPGADAAAILAQADLSNRQHAADSPAIDP